MNSTNENPQETQEEMYLPIAEAAKIRGISYGSLIQRCRRGAVPCQKIANGTKTTYHVRLSDVKGVPVIPEASVASAVHPNTAPVSESPRASNEPVQPEANGMHAGVDLHNKSNGVEPLGKKSHNGKRPIDHVKNAMRKFPASDLLKVSIWINGRLSQKFHLETKQDTLD